jgi:hypothetical protein
MTACNQRNGIRALALPPRFSKAPLEWLILVEFGTTPGFNPESNRWTIATTEASRNVWALWSPQIGPATSLQGSDFLPAQHITTNPKTPTPETGWAYITGIDFKFTWVAPPNDYNKDMLSGKYRTWDQQHLPIAWPYGAWRNALWVPGHRIAAILPPERVYAPGEWFYTPPPFPYQSTNTTSFFHHVTVPAFDMEDFPICSVSIQPIIHNDASSETWKTLKQYVQAAALMGYKDYRILSDFGVIGRYAGDPAYTALNIWSPLAGKLPDVTSHSTYDNPYYWKTSDDVSEWIYYDLLDNIPMRIEEIFLVDTPQTTPPAKSTYTMVENGARPLGAADFPYASATTNAGHGTIAHSNKEHTFAIKYSIDFEPLLDPHLGIYSDCLHGHRDDFCWLASHVDHIRDGQWYYMYEAARRRVADTVNAVANQIAGVLIKGVASGSPMSYNVIYNKFPCVGTQASDTALQAFYNRSNPAAAANAPVWPDVPWTGADKEYTCGVCFGEMGWELTRSATASYFATVPVSPNNKRDPIYSVTATPVLLTLPSSSHMPITFRLVNIYIGQPPPVKCVQMTPPQSGASLSFGQPPSGRGRGGVCEPASGTGFGNTVPSHWMNATSTGTVGNYGITASTPSSLHRTDDPGLVWTLQFQVAVSITASSNWTEGEAAAQVVAGGVLFDAHKSLKAAIHKVEIEYNNPAINSFRPLKALTPYGPPNSLHGGSAARSTVASVNYTGPAASHMIINGELLVPQAFTILKVQVRLAPNLIKTGYDVALNGIDPAKCTCTPYTPQQTLPVTSTLFGDWHYVPNPVPVQYNLWYTSPPPPGSTNYAISYVYTVGPVLPGSSQGIYKHVDVRHVNNDHHTEYGPGPKRLSLINPSVAEQPLVLKLTVPESHGLTMEPIVVGFSDNSPTDAVIQNALLVAAPGVNVVAVLLTAHSGTIDILFEPPPNVQFDDRPFPLQILASMPTCKYSWMPDSTTTYTAGPSQVGSFPAYPIQHTEDCSTALCNPCSTSTSMGVPASVPDAGWKNMPPSTGSPPASTGSPPWGRGRGHTGWHISTSVGHISTTLTTQLIYLTVWANPGLFLHAATIASLGTISFRPTHDTPEECPSTINYTQPSSFPHAAKAVFGEDISGTWKFTWERTAETQIVLYEIGYCDTAPNCLWRSSAWKAAPTVSCYTECEPGAITTLPNKFNFAQCSGSSFVIWCKLLSITASHTSGTAQILTS